MAVNIEEVKQLIRENERRELSQAEERDPVEVIPNWDYYVNKIQGEKKEDYACDECDFVGKSAKSLGAHSRVHN